MPARSRSFGPPLVPLMDTQRSVLVVGAGLAGLTAGLEIVDRGLRVTVLESRDRVGGRVWSRHLPNGEIVEMGAEWVMPEDSVLKALCARLGVALVPTGSDYRIREAMGDLAATHEEQAELLADAQRRLTSLRADEVATGSLGALLTEAEGSDRARATVRARLQGTCATGLDDVALRAVQGEGLFDTLPGEYSRVADGNQSLATAAAALLPDVRLGHRVDRLRRTGDGVEAVGVGTVGGFTASADAVVVAVPVRAAARLEFDPALPDDLVRAIGERPMGVAAKFAVATEGAPPVRSAQCADLPFWSWSGLGADGGVRHCVTSFAGSPTAQRALRTESGDPSTWLRSVEGLWPGLELVGEPLMKSWGDDELTWGSYSSLDNPAYDVADLLTRSVGRIAFAGEHTAGHDHFATMDAAVRSGRRAAGQVAAMLV